MTTPVVSLKELLIPEKKVSIEFPGYPGLEFDISYQSRDALLKIRKKCTIKKMNRRTHQPEEELDEDAFIREYASAVIKGWKGFKLSYVKDFLLADIGELEEDQELAYTQDNAELLLQNSSMFDDWLTETVGSLENFT